MGAILKTLRATMTAAVNTPTPVNIDIDGNTVAGIIVPSGYRKLTGLFVTLGASIIAVASAGVSIALRLFGDGIAVQQEVTVGAVREDTTSTGGSKIVQPLFIPTDFDVIPCNTLKISYSLGGVDPGSPEIEVTAQCEPT